MAPRYRCLRPHQWGIWDAWPQGLAANIDLDPYAVGVVHEDLSQINFRSCSGAVVKSALVQRRAQTGEVAACKGNMVEGATALKALVSVDEVQVDHSGFTEEEPRARKIKVGTFVGPVLQSKDALVERDRFLRFTRIDVDVIKSVDCHPTIVDHYSAATHYEETPMKLGLSVDEVLHTTRAVRKRLDFDKPVEREVLLECLDAAVQSPTGSNSQAWQWMIVTDPEKRAALAALYKQGFEIYANMEGNAETAYKGDDELRQAQQERVNTSAHYLAEHFEKVPAMLIPCIPRLPEGMPEFASASVYGSILPGVWSFMLAARERGLGTAWTTIHLMFEEQAAEILGIPYAEMHQCALITIGYSLGTDFKPAKRPPLDTVLHWDSW